MKLVCNGLDLADSFSKVTKAITGKSTIPILEGVKISAKGNKLILTASDTEITIENTINAEIMLEGDIIVPGKLTSELVRKMGGQSVELDSIDNKILNIKYIDSNSKINLFNYEEYPKFANDDYDLSFNITQKELKDIIVRTIFCAATDEVRPILKGCLIDINGDNITSVAIDGLRLAITKSKIYKNTDKKSIVVPAKALKDINNLLTGGDEIVTVSISDKKIMVDMAHTKVIASLLEGEFISHERIIPKNYSTTIKVVKEQLEQALDRVSIISRNLQANLIKIEIIDGTMVMSAKADIGDIIEKVPVSMEGKDIKLALNSKFLADCLNAIDEEYITMSFASSTEPCTITPIAGDSYLYLILPVRVMTN